MWAYKVSVLGKIVSSTMPSLYRQFTHISLSRSQSTTRSTLAKPRKLRHIRNKEWILQLAVYNLLRFNQDPSLLWSHRSFVSIAQIKTKIHRLTHYNQVRLNNKVFFKKGSKPPFQQCRSIVKTRSNSINLNAKHTYNL